MPTYDYKCEKCGHRFEVFQSMNDERLTDCPEQGCGGKVKRLLGTGAGIIFKGSGFYETDYKRGDSYKAAAKAEKGESSSGGSTESSSASSSSSPEPSGGKSTEKKPSSQPSS